MSEYTSLVLWYAACYAITGPKEFAPLVTFDHSSDVERETE